MAPPAPSKRARAAKVPARYAKFITAVVGDAILYVQLYGTTWHLDAFLVMAGAALGVLGVPNAPAPVPPAAAVLADRPTGGITP